LEKYRREQLKQPTEVEKHFIEAEAEVKRLSPKSATRSKKKED